MRPGGTVVQSGRCTPRGSAAQPRITITSLVGAARTIASRRRNGRISGNSTSLHPARTRFAHFGGGRCSPCGVSALGRCLGSVIDACAGWLDGYKDGGGEASDSIGLRHFSSLTVSSSCPATSGPNSTQPVSTGRRPRRPIRPRGFVSRYVRHSSCPVLRLLTVIF